MNPRYVMIALWCPPVFCGEVPAEISKKREGGNIQLTSVVYSLEELPYETNNNKNLRSKPMFQFIRKRKWMIVSFSAMVILAMLVAACGAGGSSAGSAMPVTGPAQASNNSGASTSSSSSKTGAGTQQQYLIKSFNINMQVKDTRRVAADLQAWISATDPLSLVTNVNYQQVDQNQYSVSLAFSVQAPLFPSIESYLNSYPALHGGKLLNVA